MDKSAPRYRAGSMSLPDGAGNITAMCSCGDFLEIFTENSTYRVHSPEAVDPEATDPNAPWVSTKSADFGSSSRVVARTLLQGEAMVSMANFKDQEKNKDAVVQKLHNVKEALCICERSYQRVKTASDEIVEEISRDGVDLEKGRHVKALPQIENLDDSAASFLVNAKRAIASTCYMAPLFVPLPRRDNNPESLRNRLVALNDKLYRHLIDALGNYESGAKHLVDLRNYQEHPEQKRTVITNFFVTSDREISRPVWYVTGGDPEHIVASMNAAIEFVIAMTEELLVHLIFSSLEGGIPYYVEEIPDDKVDPIKPIKYRLSIDVSQMKFKGSGI